MNAIFVAITPLLMLILIGYGAGRLYKFSVSQLGSMVAFILAPMVSLGGVIQLDYKIEFIFAPFIVALISFLAAFLSYNLGKLYLDNRLPNLSGMAASSGNTGFFGLPVFLLFQPSEKLGIYILAILGIQILEVTYGYYIAARGNASVKDSLLKVFKMPPLWAVICGLFLNIIGFEMPDIMIEYWTKAVDCWVIMGMIMIGVALASCETLRPDYKFCAHMLLSRFIIWPFLMTMVISLDYHLFHLLNRDLYFIFMILALIPLPGNSVALSATLGLHPDKMAFAVVLTTIVSALIVPYVIQMLFDLAYSL